MASTSKTQINESVVGANIQARKVRTGNIYVNTNYEEISNIEFKVPRCIPSFFGREDKIEELDTLFFKEKKTRKVVICGLPGFGKTELSKKYADHCLQNKTVDRVFWIQSEDPEKLKTSFEKLSQIYEKCENVCCLFIFDNGMSRSSIYNYEPLSENQKHFMLVTSVVDKWDDDIVPIKLDSLSPESSVNFLKSILEYREEDNNLYIELAKATDCVPLALQIVAGYVRQVKDCLNQTFQLEEYVHRIKAQETFINKTIPKSFRNTYNQSIYGALKVSLDKIKEEDEIEVKNLALNVLYVCSFLNPDFISFRHLLRISTIKKITTDNNHLRLAIGLLINFSFVKYSDNDEDCIIIHRLTQSFIRYFLKSSKLLEKYYSACLNPVLNKFNYIHERSVLSYADTYTNLVHRFFRKHKSNVERILVKLVRYGCIKCLKQFFKDPNKSAKKLICKYNLFYNAAKWHQTAIFKLLLKYVHYTTKIKGETIPHIAARSGNIKIIKILSKRGANIMTTNKIGDTPLFTLAKSIHVSENVNWNDVLKMLKFKKNLLNNNKETLLHAAAAGWNANLAEVLIANGMDVNQKDIKNNTPLDTAFASLDKYYNTVCTEKLKSTIKVLIEQGASVNVDSLKEEYEYFLLSSAFKYKNFIFFKSLLKKGCDINSRNRCKDTLLHDVAQTGNFECIKLLINDFGAKTSCVNESKETALFKFVQHVINDNRNLKISALSKTLDLLKSKHHSEMLNEWGDSPLHLASAGSHENLVLLLVRRYKFNVNKKNEFGETPLHKLIEWLNNKSNKDDVLNTVRTLKRCGTRLTIVNNKKETPLEVLQRRKNERGFDFNYLIPYLTPSNIKKFCKRRRTM